MEILEYLSLTLTEHTDKISKDISHLNHSINHLALINLHRTLHATDSFKHKETAHQNRA